MTPPPTPLRFGYGTNGFTDLRLADVLALLADLGYDGVGLTLDHMHLDPFADDLPRRVAAVARTWPGTGSTSPSRPARPTSSTPGASTSRP